MGSLAAGDATKCVADGQTEERTSHTVGVELAWHEIGAPRRDEAPGLERGDDVLGAGLRS
jgi:hypothetical protein